MALYPGWDSLDSVRTWHTVFEVSGIAFLALLVGAEILAFQYGHRKDELTAIAESVAETKRQGDADAAEARRKTDVEALQKQLSEADKKVAELDRIRQPRHLTDGGKKVLLAALSGQPKQHLVIKAGTATGDEYQYGEEIAAALRSLSWDIRVDSAIFSGSDISGVWITMKGAGGEPVPDSVVALGEAFVDAGIYVRTQIAADAAIPTGEIWISIGRKK